MTQPWYQSGRWITLLCLLAPPVGLILLLARPGRVSRKILGTVAVLILGVAHLVLFWGLRFQMDGSGMRPMFYFNRVEAHYREIERRRAEQPPSAALPVAATATAATAPAEIVPAAPAPAVKAPSEAAYWTAFRGPLRDGIYTEGAILTTWPDSGLPLLWREPIGGGYASMVAARGKVYTIEQRRAQEVVAAYDLESGRELWKNAWNASFAEPMGGDGPRATPTWNDGRLYALGAAGEFRCLDAETGKVFWSKNILADNRATNIQWGMAASPLVVDDKVIVLPGGPAGKSVVAYDRLTGKPVWTALDDKTAYTSPVVVTLAGKRQLLVVTATRAVGLSVEEGKLLWEYPWSTQYDINSAQPVMAGENRFIISAGYGHGAALVEIEKKDEGFAARTVWANNQMKNKFNSSVLYQGHLYGLDEGILVCTSVETGERKWKGGRYGYGQVLLASGHLVVLSETGDVALIEATPDGLKEVAKFSALEGKTWNVPAIAEGRLLVRNTTDMACYRIAAD